MPNCKDKECGDDGCDGSCGDCGDYERCKNGTCEAVCKPDYPKDWCGGDGCGDDCTCSGDYQTCGYDDYCTPRSDA